MVKSGEFFSALFYFKRLTVLPAKGNCAGKTVKFLLVFFPQRSQKNAGHGICNNGQL